jgi:hypothetical protein
MQLGDRTEEEALRPPSDPEAVIWRYMSFAKFVAMLEARALYFSRLDCFTDRFEGTLSKASVGLDEELSVEVNAQMTYAEVRRFVRKLRKNLFVNCWFMSQGESEGIWRLYGGGDQAVAIQSTYSRLMKAISKRAIWVGTVRYIDYETDEVSFRWTFLPALHKRKAFEHEQELRAIYDRVFPTAEVPLGEYEPVDLNALVAKLYVAPGSPCWFRETVKRVAERYGLNVTVDQSKLDISPFE